MIPLATAVVPTPTIPYLALSTLGGAAIPRETDVPAYPEPPLTISKVIVPPTLTIAVIEAPTFSVGSMIIRSVDTTVLAGAPSAYSSYWKNLALSTKISVEVSERSPISLAVG